MASPRDDALLGRTPAPDPISLLPVEEPGSLRIAVPAGTPAPEIRLELAAAEGMSTRPAILVRSLAAEPDRAAAPTDALVELPETPGEPPADAAAQPSADASVPSPSDTPAQPPAQSPGATSAAVPVDLAGLPPGIRLVMAALVPIGAEPVDPATIHLAWIVIAAAPTAEADPT